MKSAEKLKTGFDFDPIPLLGVVTTISNTNRPQSNTCVRYNLRRLLLFAILLVILSIVVLSNVCIGTACDSNRATHLSTSPFLSSLVPFSLYSNNFGIDYLTANQNDIDHILLRTFSFDYDEYQQLRNERLCQIDFDYIIKSNTTFDMKTSDVMVFLHMQKTGGSAFDRHLVRNLKIENPCKCDAKRKKRCSCFRPGNSSQYWLFSRYSVGWRCGLHADFTELINCVDRVLNELEQRKRNNPSLPTLSPFLEEQRRYFYVVMLRDPVARFLSEFKHVQRGATWKASRHWCDGRLPTRQELQSCFHGPNWRNVSLVQFISCPYNLAFNRQTRMLADLSLVGCYNRSLMTPAERDAVMLFSAKQNLKRMAFFGLCEEQLVSQYVFERTFNLLFDHPFVQFNQTRSKMLYDTLNTATIQQIRELNHLDMELYSYAKKLFKQRFSLLKEADENFDNYFTKLVQRSQNQLKQSRWNRMTDRKIIPLNANNTNRHSLSISKKIEKNSFDSDNSADDIYDGSIMSTDPTDDSVEDYYTNHLDSKKEF